MSNECQNTVVVRRHPFISPEARHLVALLDADLAAMYPDWDELAHPTMHHENNPRPPQETDTAKSSQDGDQKGLYFFIAFTRPIPSSSDFTAQHGDAIACGALRTLPEPTKLLPPELDSTLTYAEVKRMYVHPDYRGRGISKLILVELEIFAKNALKLDVLLLETGLRQAAAVALYESAGYTRRDMYGEYVGADPGCGGDSICLEKQLR